jgi:hypothetical protein
MKLAYSSQVKLNVHRCVESLRLHKPLTLEELVQKPLFSPTIIVTTVTLNIVPASGMEGLVSGMEGLGSNP